MDAGNQNYSFTRAGLFLLGINAPSSHSVPWLISSDDSEKATILFWELCQRFNKNKLAENNEILDVALERLSANMQMVIKDCYLYKIHEKSGSRYSLFRYDNELPGYVQHWEERKLLLDELFSYFVFLIYKTRDPHFRQRISDLPIAAVLQKLEVTWTDDLIDAQHIPLLWLKAACNLRFNNNHLATFNAILNSPLPSLESLHQQIEQSGLSKKIDKWEEVFYSYAALLLHAKPPENMAHLKPFLMEAMLHAEGMGKFIQSFYLVLGADPCEPYQDKFLSPLSSAATWRNGEPALHLYLWTGANPNKAGKQKDHPVYRAVSGSATPAFLKTLLEAGADHSPIIDEQGNTPIDSKYAKEVEKQILRNAGAHERAEMSRVSRYFRW